MPKIVKANCDDTAHLTPKKEQTTVKLTSARSDIVIKKGYSPYIGDNGHWYEYDVDICAFVDTGIVAQGESGKDGYTPIKGIDYFTEDDYQAIAELMPTVPDWAMAEVKPTYTASEVGAAETEHKHTLDDLGSFQPMELILKRNTYIETNGLEKPYSAWTSTDFIPIESGKRYQLYWNLSSAYCCWYKDDRSFHSQVTFNTGMTDIFAPPSAAFLRVSNRDAAMATLTISTVQGIGLVKTVNNISPDSDGNIDVPTPNIFTAAINPWGVSGSTAKFNKTSFPTAAVGDYIITQGVIYEVTSTAESAAISVLKIGNAIEGATGAAYITASNAGWGINGDNRNFDRVRLSPNTPAIGSIIYSATAGMYFTVTTVESAIVKTTRIFKDVPDDAHINSLINEALSAPNGNGGASSWDSLTDKPFDSIDENTLIAKDGVLSVITTDVAEQDNTKPITSSGVHVIVGNIDTLLSLI